MDCGTTSIEVHKLHVYITTCNIPVLSTYVCFILVLLTTIHVTVTVTMINVKIAIVTITAIGRIIM